MVEIFAFRRETATKKRPGYGWLVGKLVQADMFFFSVASQLLMIHLKEMFTRPKFNMEPENQSLEKGIPIGNHHFQLPC